MALLFSYLLESFLVHLPDALLAGGGYYLIRFSRWTAAGVGLMIIYIVAISGSALSDDPFDWWGPTAAVVGVLIAHALGAFRKKPT